MDVSRNCATPLTAYYALNKKTKKQTVEFRQEVVRVALTSGLSCKQVASTGAQESAYKRAICTSRQYMINQSCKFNRQGL